ncbi:hypothetical protein [Ideonella livida]|uniref:DUF983 domain-containing protein n=1 Tax=Ideonella livida TaxID=2707176 RepID=A0A7C9PKX3_9BURK|nr:hypothetical protein [Ideonella livida]NDY93952.1 hypothetical protein [Ideonella livida]
MFPALNPLTRFACPHCQQSLRWRKVPANADGAHDSAGAALRTCPACGGTVVERRHPALSNPWLWTRFYLPGVLLCALGIFVPALGWLLPLAGATLAGGLVLLLVYMVRARWRWAAYGLPAGMSAAASVPGAVTSRREASVCSPQAGRGS